MTLSRMVPLTVLLTGACLGAAPVALVFEHVDGYTNADGAARLLRDAGFTVREADSFATLDTRGVDLIVFGSFLSERPGYADFVQNQKTGLQSAVEAGAVFLQFTARFQTEPTPSYLPRGLTISRADDDFSEVFALQPRHPLLMGMPLSGTDFQLLLPSHLEHPPSWETLQRQQGFGVILSSDALGTGPVLVEAAHGRGRFLITSLAFDKQYRGSAQIASAEYQNISRLFLLNLLRYVEATRNGSAPQVAATQSPDVPAPGSWCIVLLPDTQYYVTAPATNSRLFRAQTEWIVQQQVPWDIRFVLHLGDITESNVAPEWQLAQGIMNTLDGHVPYALVPGNHDFGVNGPASDRSTLLSRYFPPAKHLPRTELGGVMEPERMENSYHVFESGQEKWLVVALEWSPRNRTVAWANQVVAAHPDHRAIILTHAYLYYDDTRYDWNQRRDQAWSPAHYGTARDPDGWNDGEALWQKLVSQHPNIVMVVNGHVLGDGIGFLSSTGAHEQTVQQMLVNFQMRPNGGEGFLRVLEIMPDQRTVRVRDYSPALDRFLLGRQSNFRFSLEASPSARRRRVAFGPNQIHSIAEGSTVVLAPHIEERAVAHSFQWRKNGVAIAGETARALGLPHIRAAEAGSYTLDAVAISGATSTWSASVNVGSPSSRLGNISVRGAITGPGEQLTLGFVFGGQTAVPTLIRAIGPALAGFGVSAVVRDPRLVVFDRAGRSIAANDNWGDQTGAQLVANLAAQVGAAELPIASKDAAIALDVAAGALTATCVAADESTGIALLELFQAEVAPADKAGLKNFSVRGRTGTGEDTLTLGFVITGTASHTVLIRGVGPALRSFDVGNPVGDPILRVFDQNGRVIGSNDDWGELEDLLLLHSLFAQVGAFTLPPGGRDAALLVTLAPGAYTIRCEGKDESNGSVLLEVYDLR